MPKRHVLLASAAGYHFKEIVTAHIQAHFISNRVDFTCTYSCSCRGIVGRGGISGGRAGPLAAVFSKACSIAVQFLFSK